MAEERMRTAFEGWLGTAQGLAEASKFAEAWDVFYSNVTFVTLYIQMRDKWVFGPQIDGLLSEWQHAGYGAMPSDSRAARVRIAALKGILRTCLLHGEFTGNTRAVARNAMRALAGQDPFPENVRRKIEVLALAAIPKGKEFFMNTTPRWRAFWLTDLLNFPFDEAQWSTQKDVYWLSLRGLWEAIQASNVEDTKASDCASR